jgi:hypothetical protein
MTSLETWRPVHKALDVWHAAGAKAFLWLRDDDAVEPTPPLKRLIDLTARSQIPLALAVVPAKAGKTLARELPMAKHVTAIVHGWAHLNHAPEDQKKQEFGPHRPIDVMRQELFLAISKMNELFPSQTTPMFTPPWNRITPSLIPTLRELNYAALSRFGVATDDNHTIPEINTHVDIIDFRGTRRCKEPKKLANELASALSHSFHHGRYAVGILSHHLVHDEAAFEFLADLFSVTQQELWLTVPRLIERRTALVG